MAVKPTVLMVAFHVPPSAGGSGHLRTLGFARHLPAAGWQPVILSARASAYPITAPLEQGIIPEGCPVYRVLALDARRHFGIGGKYPGFIAQPDRWISWYPAAVLQGLRLIRRHRVAAIWSTYPIMTAHCIARSLSRISGLPWIADFRDPVSGSIESNDAALVASQLRWERRVVRDAARTVFTTESASHACAQHYPDVARDNRFRVIANGYDEVLCGDLPHPEKPETAGRLVLLHSGVLYREGRDPIPFLSALARLKKAGIINARNLKVVLRACGSYAVYASEAGRLEIADIVEIAPRLSNKEALAEQAKAHGLLLFQGEKYDRQIPAKVYEYLRIGRPIFALVGEKGDTAALLRQIGAAELVAMDDINAIEAGLKRFIAALREGRAARISPEVAIRYSRRAGAESLAALLDEVAMKNDSIERSEDSLRVVPRQEEASK
jgi:hypothetical protein